MSEEELASGLAAMASVLEARDRGFEECEQDPEGGRQLLNDLYSFFGAVEAQGGDTTLAAAFAGGCMDALGVPTPGEP